MKILCLDIGNTSTTFCVAEKVINALNRIPRSEDVISFFNNYDSNNINQVIISSVVPELSIQLKDIFKSKNLNVFEVSHENCGVNLKVQKPSEVGNDRICNVAGANRLYGGECVIVDFGTATTYDIVNKDGGFIGGAIAPGIDVSADNLISKASLLKDTIYQFPKTVIGNNTKSNIQSGVMYSGLYSVSGMINKIKEEMNCNSLKIVLTGGFGKLISEKLQIDHEYNERLTLEGMLEIYRKLKIS